MTNLTLQQQNKLKKLAKVVDGGNLAIVQYLMEIDEKNEEKIKEIEAKIPDLEKVVGHLKGKDGKDGQTGQSIRGKDGRNGEDGKDYILTEKDKKEIAQKITVPVVKQIIETKTIIKEQPIVKETIIKEAIPLHTSPEEIRNLLELLGEDERLDAKSIKNLELAFKAYLQLNPPNGPMLHPVSLGNLPDVNVAGATVGQVLTWNGVYWYAANGGGGGSTTIYTDTVSGTIDGVNTTFTVSHSITSAIVLVLANSNYQPGVDFTTSGTTITMMVAPDSSLSGQSFWCSHT